MRAYPADRPLRRIALPWKRGRHNGWPAALAALPFGLAVAVERRRASETGRLFRFLTVYKPGRHDSRYMVLSRAGLRRVLSEELAAAGYVAHG